MAKPAARLLAVLVAGAALAAGCGRPSRSMRRPLAGTVVVDGLPAFSGVISLSPQAGHAGPVASAPIQDGRYAFTAVNGPTAGPYRAVVVFVRDAAEARSFQAAHGKARPPRPLDAPASPAAPAGAGDEQLEAEGVAPSRDSPASPAEGSAVEPDGRGSERRPPANIREFDVTVPATDPPRLDFAIADGGSA